MKRVFLAIRFSENEFLGQYINTIQSQLRAEKIKWIDSNNIHLTLKFFGPIEESLLKKIKISLENALKSQQTFEISFNKLGIFGSKYQPRVLWMGLQNDEKIINLESIISQELTKIGITTDRQNFVPHLSIARIKHLASKKYFQSVIDRHNDFDSKEILIDRIFLYQSILRPEGPIYKVLKEFKLEQS